MGFGLQSFMKINQSESKDEAINLRSVSEALQKPTPLVSEAAPSKPEAEPHACALTCAALPTGHCADAGVWMVKVKITGRARDKEEFPASEVQCVSNEPKCVLHQRMNHRCDYISYF